MDKAAKFKDNPSWTQKDTELRFWVYSEAGCIGPFGPFSQALQRPSKRCSQEQAKNSGNPFFYAIFSQKS